jgi:hypothetical protein
LCERLTKEEVNEIGVKIRSIENQNQITKERKKELNCLKREERLHHRKKVLSSIKYLNNHLKTEEINRVINKEYANIKESIHYVVCDNGSNILNYCANAITINCFGHNINLILKHFVETLEQNYEKKLMKLIGNIRANWKLIEPFLHIEEERHSLIVQYFEFDVNITDELNESIKVNIANILCIIRWKTVWSSSTFIYHNIKKLKALSYSINSLKKNKRNY